MTVRDGLGFKAKRPGARRPFIETKSVPSQSHRLGKLVHRETLIDRDNDYYRETVTDYETGEVIHHDAGVRVPLAHFVQQRKGVGIDQRADAHFQFSRCFP